MPLDGVNKKCARCKQTCKQWRQVKVIICPNFVDVTKSGVEIKNLVDSKHNKMAETPLSACQIGEKGKATIIAPKSQEGA